MTRRLLFPCRRNLFCITGGEGTGKSNYVGAFIAGTIHQTDKIDTFLKLLKNLLMKIEFLSVY
jgi:hypothetical protein